MFQMLEKKREYYLGSGNLLRFRVWTALASSVMQGLTHNHAQEAPTSVQEFLALYRFESARDEENRGSGSRHSSLQLSGNLPVVRELIDSKGVDVRARVRVDVHDFGAEKGMDALALAAACCPSARCTKSLPRCSRLERIRMLSSANGATPLIAAVGFQNLGGVCALLACDKVDIEKGFLVNSASPLNIAGYLSTFEILKLWSKRGRTRRTGKRSKNVEIAVTRLITVGNLAMLFRTDHGASILTDICGNDSAHPEWFEFASAAIGTVVKSTPTVRCSPAQQMESDLYGVSDDPASRHLAVRSRDGYGTQRTRHRCACMRV